MNRLLNIAMWIFILLTSLSPALAQEDGWPRTLSLDEGVVTIYPLQVDGINGDVVHYRAALAFRSTPDAEPVFGAGWFDSKVSIVRNSRVVSPLNLTVTNTRFPEGTEDVQVGLAAALAEQAPGWNLDFSLDELNAALKVAEAEAKSALELNTAPPRIIYRDHPALLVTLDGKPVLRDIENSPYQAVINTPYPLIFDGRHYYLNAASGAWYRADSATGPYRFEPSPPAAIAAMVKPDQAEEPGEQTVEAVTAANAPEIVVSTQPVELIVTEGPAVFVPLVDDLLVLKNSDDDVFMHVGTQQFYVVLAGRWYHADSLKGPWSYQAANQLPPAFADIPYDSDQADSRVYVAGTPEAEEAVLDAQVPQTAAVSRGEADIEVTYDGSPEFEPVDGTNLEYAANTGATVLQSDRLYYLVEDGVWYVSATPNGPWEVATRRPASVDTIAPTSPVYHVRYVYIYDSTPDVVYVGYTPGYLGSYVYYGTVVYGTGWYYRPWVSPYYYYPRPSTWGFHVGYNPWFGWSFGLSWGWGPFYANYYSGGYWHHNHYWHHRHYSHWGPRGYRPRPPHRGHSGHSRDRYAYDGHGYDARRGSHRGRNDNLYRDNSQRARVVSTRDNLPRQRRGRDGIAWKADEAVATGSRQFSTRDKEARRRVDPIRTSDLRRKAQLRDANFEAGRSRLVADKRGNVRPRSKRDAAKGAIRAPGGPSPKAPKARPTPIRSTAPVDPDRKTGLDAARRAAYRANRSAAAATAQRRQSQAAAQASRQPQRWPLQGVRKADPPAVAERPTQRSGAALTKARSAPPPSGAKRRAVPQPVPGSRGNAAPQGRSPVATAPPPRQYAAQTRPALERAPKASHSSPPPTQRAAQSHGKLAGGQGNRPNRGAENRGQKRH